MKIGKELQNIQHEIHIVLNLTGKIIQTMDKEDEEVTEGLHLPQLYRVQLTLHQQPQSLLQNHYL